MEFAAGLRKLKSLEMFIKNFRRVERHQIDGTHHAHMTHPQRVAQLINPFLDRIY